MSIVPNAPPDRQVPDISPLPWSYKVLHGGSMPTAEILNAHGGAVTYIPIDDDAAEPDARLIVTAVNAYPRLRRIEAAQAEVVAALTGCAEEMLWYLSAHASDDQYEARLDAARAALALARAAQE